MKAEREGLQRPAAGLAIEAVVVVGIVDELLDGEVEMQPRLALLLWRGLRGDVPREL